MIKIGIGLDLTRNQSGVVSFDSSFQAVLNRGTALGYTLPGQAFRTKGNNLVIALKAAGIWSRLDNLYVMATDGDSNFATLNWITPASYQLSRVSSPVFLSGQGYKGDDVAAYLDTNFIPSTHGVNYTLNNASRFVYCYAPQTGGVKSFDGVLANLNNQLRTGNNAAQKINTSTNLSSSFNTGGNGLKVISRSSSSQIFLGNSNTGITRTDTSNSTSLEAGSQVLLAASISRSDATISIYGMGADLTAYYASLVSVFNNYMMGL